MKIFHCPRCEAVLFFDNLVCTCGLAVSFSAPQQHFTSAHRFCANRETISCNWSCEPQAELCHSCQMTSVHPDLSVAGNAELWARAEAAKRHVLIGLMQWGWLTAGDTGPRPEFHMLAEATGSGSMDVTMGHAAGVVTINLAEADNAERVRRRETLGEPYRTVIGHFRHEIAHYLFDRLNGYTEFRDAFRAMFGDETRDYATALARHYENGSPPNWQETHVTAYASAHPHEDWAETSAHSMHLCDIVDSFLAAGLRKEGIPAIQTPPHHPRDPADMIETALKLGVALNHVNRAVGQPDIYPFVNSAVAREKLIFVLNWLRKGPVSVNTA